MASEDDILISDLAESHPLTLNGNDTIIPIAHPDSGSETGYATMSTTPNQMGAYAVQSQTHANLKTSSKTVESSINQVVSNLAPDFSTSETYAVDAIVLYEGNLYKCITAVETAGDWDSTKWTQIKVTDLESGGGGSSTFAGLTDVSLNNPQNGQVPKYNSTSGKWENANESGGGSGGHTIVDEEGTSLTQRTNLQFNGAYLEDNSTDDTTEVNVVRSMTRAEFDQLSADEKQGIIEITDEAGNGAYHEYSTNEQIIGKWVDGSTLYEKTVYSAGGVTGAFTMPHNISNIDRVISYTGTVKDTAYSTYGDIWVLPRIATPYIGVDKVTSTDIAVVNPSDFSTRLVDWYITIRYTKSSS